MSVSSAGPRSECPRRPSRWAVGSHDLDRIGEHRQAIGETVCAAQYTRIPAPVLYCRQGKLQPGLTRSVRAGQRLVGTAYSGAQVGECGARMADRSATLDAEQPRLAALEPDPWPLPSRPFVVAGCFVAFVRGQQDRATLATRCGSARPSCAARTGAGRLGGRVGPRRRPRPSPGRLALRGGRRVGSGTGRAAFASGRAHADVTCGERPRCAGSSALHFLWRAPHLPSAGVTHTRPLRAGPRKMGRRRLEIPLRCSSTSL